ncbi:hypothetical protein DAT35_56685 [Vitiosangium sp. GDMCC 1.1324]|nr:hypothetical protein DAT35_56685 [Vitiosangium sp. GDMCC 1.1324]
MCWTVSAAGIDEAVARLFLETVQPPEIELGLAITVSLRRRSSAGAETALGRFLKSARTRLSSFP